jgi:RNA polymerase sigma factor (sigma-70 family)
MANAPLTSVLRHIRKLAAAENSKDLTDGQLLDSFSSHHDEAAFAVLVRRHGPLVLRVCRRVLRQEQDAEDAFQATFFVLARKAASIRKREALVNWLHGVAYRMAMNAKREAARRREREARAKASSEKNVGRELAWRDVQGVLEEEIQRLPEKYRAPFLLCCVEERSRAEVARQLHLKEGTVWSRLSRARKLLQQQLAARGVELSAVLGAAAVAEETGRAAVPVILMKSTVKAALQYAAGRGAAPGVASAKAAALANGVIQAMFTSNLKIATALLLASAALTGTGVLTYEAATAQQMPSTRPASAKTLKGDAPTVQAKEFADQLVVSGRVLDPDGEPVQGAKLYVWTSALQKRADRVERATTQKDGRFRLTVSKAERGREAKIVASARGFGPEWLDLGDADASDITLCLAKDDVPIEGRVLDLEARPIPDVVVEVSGLQQGDLKPWIEARRGGSYPDLLRRIAPQALDCSSSVKTGKDGLFRLTGFGRDRVVQLKIHGTNIENSTFWVITRHEPVPGLRTGHYGTYTAAFDHLANLSKPIVGTIRDKASGKPIAGITVASSMYHWVFGKSDGQGRYRLSGVGKHKEYTLSAGGAPYFNCTKMNIPDTPGLEAITVDFELERGVAIRGRLLERATGKPVSGYVGFMAAPDNPNLKNYSTLGGLQAIATNENKTKADGSFTVVAVPGPGLLTAVADDRTSYLRAKLDGIKTAPSAIMEQYHGVVPIHASEDDPKSTTCDIILDRGRSIEGSVVDQDGKPLTGALATGLGDVPDFFGFRESKLETTSFKAGGLDPKRPRSLFFFHAEKKLAKLQPVRSDEAGPLTVRLEPLGSVTGRVLDANGTPRAGLKVAVMHSYQRQDYEGLPLELIFEYPSWTKVIDNEATTDAEGRFHSQGLVPGLKYFLNVKDGEEILAAYTKESVMVESGKTMDLGELKDRKASEKGAKE